MKKIFLWLALLALPVASALAQTATSGALSGSQSSSGSNAASGSAAVINQTWSAPGAVRTTYDGTYTVRNVPQVYAPSIVGGANPCVVGATAGGAVAGFGLTIGASFNDPGCERRNLAVLAHQMGHPALAQEILCGSSDVRQARQRLGQPCLSDQGAAPAPPIASSGAVQGSAPVIRPVAIRPADPVRPDFCFTLSSVDERRRYSRQCGG